MNKERYQKKIQLERLKHKDDLCECCGKEHNHTYGTGRFCSNECRVEYIAQKKRGAKNPKIKAHLDRLRQEGKIAAQAPYGTWKCNACNLIFNTRRQQDEHMMKVHKHIYANGIPTKNEKVLCPYCGREFASYQSLGGHSISCPKHPNKAEHDDVHKRQGRTYSRKYANGEIKQSIKSHRHTLETKQKISAKRAEQVRNEYLLKFHAKVKWYKVKNIAGQEFAVRGHWEEHVAMRLNELGILWVKASPIKYFKDYWHNYSADFYIPSKDIYVEVKGRYPDADREKMRLVVEQNPDKKIYFIHDQYNDFVSGKCEFDDDLLIKEQDL